MKLISLYLLYARRLISYYVEGKTGSLSDIVHLEEGFYHDLKGLFSKRLGLPINKYRTGERSSAIAEDIRAGASEVIRHFAQARFELFRVLPPDWALVSGFRRIDQLKYALKNGAIDKIISLLDDIKQTSDSFYKARVACTRFELPELLKYLVRDLKTECNINNKINNSHHSMKLPYSDYNTWRRILYNFIINAIEACEGKGKEGKVEITLTYPQVGTARVKIADNGVGMDSETVANFTKRGFTKAKATGQGLGVNEDAISFLNRSGKFIAESRPGEGTTITIEIESAKITVAQARTYVVSPIIWRKLRVAAALIILAMAAYLLLAIPFEGIRFWLTPDINDFRFTRQQLEQDSMFFQGIQALNIYGDFIWEIDFDSTENIEGNIKPLINDFNGDGKKDIIFPVNHHPKVGKSQLICMDGKKRILWKALIGPSTDRAIFDFPPGAEGGYNIDIVEEVRNFGSTQPIILVICSSNMYPTQVLLLDSKEGKRVKEYWHAGHITTLESRPVFDYDGDTRPELILFGGNNRLGWSSVVFILEYDNLAGQSPPWVDSVLERASEDAYYVFGHPWIEETMSPSDSCLVLYAASTTINRVGMPGIDMIISPKWNGAFWEGRSEVHLYTADKKTITLNENFNIVSIVPDTLAFSRDWWYPRQCGAINPGHWTRKDYDELYGYRKYVKGELVTDSILINREKYDWSYWKNH